MKPDYESVVAGILLPELEKGRPGFDLPHTKAVVYWIKRICKAEPQLDKKVLVTAAYAHDWGYIGLFDSGATGLDEVMKKKKLHMEIGATKIHDLLTLKLADFYTPDQIDRVSHLVGVHDKLKVVSDDDEIALVEADTFGSLDCDRVKPTFSKVDNDRYIIEMLKWRRPLFKHALAIRVFNELMDKRVQFYLK